MTVAHADLADPWTSVLDGLEHDLLEATSAIQRGEIPTLARFDAPRGLPALPDRHAARALSIAHRQRELESAVQARLSELGRQLAAGSATSTNDGGSRRPHRFEARA